MCFVFSGELTALQHSCNSLTAPATGMVHAWVRQIVLKCDVFKTIFAIRPFSPLDAAMLAAEATPWLQPRSHGMAAGSDHAMRLRIKQAGRALPLDAQEARVQHNSDGRPSNAD